MNPCSVEAWTACNRLPLGIFSIQPVDGSIARMKRLRLPTEMHHF